MDGTVTTADMALVKSRIACEGVDKTGFVGNEKCARADTNAGGTVTTADMALVKSRLACLDSTAVTGCIDSDSSPYRPGSFLFQYAEKGNITLQVNGFPVKVFDDWCVSSNVLLEGQCAVSSNGRPSYVVNGSYCDDACVNGACVYFACRSDLNCPSVQGPKYCRVNNVTNKNESCGTVTTYRCDFPATINSKCVASGGGLGCSTCDNGCSGGVCVSENLTLTGSLYVTSNPSSAYLYVDSAYKGLTPALVTNLNIGSHSVKLTKSGYNNYSTTKYIYAGSNTLSATLVLKTGNCTDSDGGINYYTFGTVTAQGAVYSDACSGNKTLYERYCSGANPLSTTFTCNTTCSGGRCL